MPTRFLTKRLVLSIHRDQIQTFGGITGLRDEGLLDSALEQPRASFAGRLPHESLHEQAAAYLFHLASNHPFNDGNKRVAFAAMETFLRLNDHHLDMTDDEAYEMVMRVADGELGKDELVSHLKRFVAQG